MSFASLFPGNRYFRSKIRLTMTGLSLFHIGTNGGT